MRVKSLSMATFTAQEVEMLDHGGNEVGHAQLHRTRYRRLHGRGCVNKNMKQPLPEACKCKHLLSSSLQYRIITASADKERLCKCKCCLPFPSIDIRKYCFVIPANI